MADDTCGKEWTDIIFVRRARARVGFCMFVCVVEPGWPAGTYAVVGSRRRAKKVYTKLHEDMYVRV